MATMAHLDTASLDQAAKFFRVMQKAGADFSGVMQDRVQRRNLAEYLQRGCPKVGDNGEVVTNQLPEGHELARLILSDDYISAQEVAIAHGVSYSDEQLEHFADTLPDTQTILWLRANGYMLIAGPPTELNLLQIGEFENKLFYSYSQTKGWYAKGKEKFVKDDKVTACEWLAIRKEVVPNSFSKTWKEQLDLITEVEHVPNTPEVIYAVTAYYKVRGIYLLRGKYVRMSSVDSGGRHVSVGYFDVGGLSVYYHYDDSRGDDLGVASSRKLV